MQTFIEWSPVKPIQGNHETVLL